MILPSSRKIVGVPSTDNEPAYSKFLEIGFSHLAPSSKMSPANKSSKASTLLSEHHAATSCWYASTSFPFRENKTYLTSILFSNKLGISL